MIDDNEIKDLTDKDREEHKMMHLKKVFNQETGGFETLSTVRDNQKKAEQVYLA